MEKEWKKVSKDMDSKPITTVKPGDKCYIELRAWGYDYYISIGLPDPDNINYVVLCTYVQWNNTTHTSIILFCDLFKQRFVWKNTSIYRYGMNQELTQEMVLIDNSFCQKYSKILSTV